MAAPAPTSNPAARADPGRAAKSGLAASSDQRIPRPRRTDPSCRPERTRDRSRSGPTPTHRHRTEKDTRASTPPCARTSSAAPSTPRPRNSRREAEGDRAQPAPDASRSARTRRGSEGPGGPGSTPHSTKAPGTASKMSESAQSALRSAVGARATIPQGGDRPLAGAAPPRQPDTHESPPVGTLIDSRRSNATRSGPQSIPLAGGARAPAHPDAPPPTPAPTGTPGTAITATRATVATLPTRPPGPGRAATPPPGKTHRPRRRNGQPPPGTRTPSPATIPTGQYRTNPTRGDVSDLRQPQVRRSRASPDARRGRSSPAPPKAHDDTRQYTSISPSRPRPNAARRATPPPATQIATASATKQKTY